MVTTIKQNKKVNIKVQIGPQSQAAYHQNEEEKKKDKNQRVQNKQTNAREAHRPDLFRGLSIPVVLKLFCFVQIFFQSNIC